MEERLAGRKAVVTGAGAGIGRASAVSFAREGARVLAIDRDGRALESLAAEAPEITPAIIELTDPGVIERWAESAPEVDVLFNCAGVVHHGSILACTADEWETAFAVNVTSMFRMTRALLPGMLAAGRGTIINMASVASSLKGVADRCAYGTSKAAVIGLTKSVAADVVASGVRCNAIAPGTVDTPSFRLRASAGDDPEATLDAFVQRQPMGRLGTTGEIAALAVYLASDESAFVTGGVFVIDGGMTL